MTIDEMKKMFTKMKSDILEEDDWKKLAQIVNLERKKGIDAQVSPDGTPFAPLKASTIARKTRKGSPNPTLALVDTGKYRNATVEADSKGGKVVIAKSRQTIAPYHQNGTENMKARPNMGIYPDAETKIFEYVKRIFMKKLKAILGK